MSRILAAALAALALANPASAEDAAPDLTVAATPDAAPCAGKPARKGPGLGALLSAANRAGAGDLLSGRSGAFLGGGKRSAIAGAVLGSALSAANSDDAVSSFGGGYAGPTMAPGGGTKTAQIAAVAATTLIGLAQSQAAGSACPR